MIHLVQMQALQVGNFAGNMDRENLTLARDGGFGANAKPFDDENAFRGPAAIGSNRPSGLPMANVDRKRTDRGDIIIIQPCDGVEPPKQGRQNQLPLQASISSSYDLRGRNGAERSRFPTKVKEARRPGCEDHGRQGVLP